MTAENINLLVLNGVADVGMVNVVKADSMGKISFDTGGSCNMAMYLPRESIDVNHFIIDQHQEQDVNEKLLWSQDVVLCEISDPDSHAMALSKARSLYNVVQEKVPWINNPHKVLNTKREIVPQLLSDVDGVIAPRTLRIKPDSIEDIRSAIKANEFSLPVLLRPTGSHGGKGLVLIKTLADLESIDITQYAQAFITEFVDYSQRGLYCKYRFAVVAGEPLLRHVLFYDQWMIHSEARVFTASRPDLQKAEAEALANFEEDLKPRVQGVIREIYEKIGLDYFGIDCAIKDDRLILFEVNANMNILNNNQPLPNIWEQAIDRILTRLIDKLILVRAKSRV